MDADELAAWARRFAKKGARGGVNEDKPAPVAARQPAQPQRWAMPGHDPGSFAQAPVGTTWGPSARIETDMIVRPGPSAYADMMASVPDLAPDITGGADAMSGTVSAESAKNLRDAMGGGGNFTVRDARGNVVGSSSAPGIPVAMESIAAFPQGIASGAPVPLSQLGGPTSSAQPAAEAPSAQMELPMGGKPDGQG